MSGAGLLPAIRTYDDFLRSPRDEATYRPAVEAICRRHGLDASRLAKYPGGSTIVFAVGDAHVVKLFEPPFAPAWETERTALEAVDGRLGIPTPRVVAAGELEEWRYVVMTQLRGRLLSDAFDEIPPRDRLAIFRLLGEVTARLHAIPAEEIGLPPEDWAAWIAEQRRTCVERQRAKGVPEDWLAQIPDFLASVDLDDAPRTGPVLLHTELMREHVMVEPGPDGWTASGLFDFEPAMRGAPEYDFASAGFFLAGGEPGAFREFLRAYGYGDAEITYDLQRRLLAYGLLHRYSNFRWYFDLRPPRVATLDALAAEWYSFD